ncbi:MAG: hypothetical protein AVDCRST_MAG69-2905, partial [uncultured Solirubrobacteraceae bacterium]
ARPGAAARRSGRDAREDRALPGGADPARRPRGRDSRHLRTGARPRRVERAAARHPGLRLGSRRAVEGRLRPGGRDGAPDAAAGVRGRDAPRGRLRGIHRGLRRRTSRRPPAGVVLLRQRHQHVGRLRHPPRQRGRPDLVGPARLGDRRAGAGGGRILSGTVPVGHRGQAPAGAHRLLGIRRAPLRRGHHAARRGRHLGGGAQRAQRAGRLGAAAHRRRAVERGPPRPDAAPARAPAQHVRRLRALHRRGRAARALRRAGSRRAHARRRLGADRGHPLRGPAAHLGGHRHRRGRCRRRGGRDARGDAVAALRPRRRGGTAGGTADRLAGLRAL